MDSPDDLQRRRKRFLQSLASVLGSATALALQNHKDESTGAPGYAYYPTPAPTPQPSAAAAPSGNDSETATLDLPESPILLQSFVEERGRSADGAIVELLRPAWHAIIKALANDPHALHTLPPRALEELIAASYDAAGFDEVVLTPRSADFGRDVVAIRRDGFMIRIIDQVKAYSPGHRVTANDVRALSGVLHGDHSATKGVVSTTSTFAPGIQTDPYLAPLIPYRLELFDGKALTQRLLALRA